MGDGGLLSRSFSLLLTSAVPRTARFDESALAHDVSYPWQRPHLHIGKDGRAPRPTDYSPSAAGVVGRAQRGRDGSMFECNAGPSPIVKSRWIQLLQSHAHERVDVQPMRINLP